MRAALLSLVLAAAAHASPPTPWSLARAPAPGPARAIGGYSAGCIAGAVALPLAGDGFRVARPERHRVFGHPLLIAMIEALAGQLKKLHLGPLAVGDLGQPRGGPAPSGHASHQTGLDVDLWFVAPHGSDSVSMVDAARQQPSPAFASGSARLVELTARDPRVDRLFLNPVLKRALCTTTTGDRGWLRKVRPWWGHADHIHVRLACPADSPECQPQAALPPGDGCDTLAWWFNAKDEDDRGKQHQSYTAKVGAMPALPLGCDALIAP
jgi:penicillin-insensitive murein endopeptidase